MPKDITGVSTPNWLILKAFKIVFIISLISLFFLQNYYSFEKLREGINLSAYNWSKAYDLSDKDQAELFQNARNNGINTVYIDISEYIDILESEDRNAEGFEDKILTTIAIARNNNVDVNFLGGNEKWYRSNYKYIPILLLEFTEKINQKLAKPINELQLDIEFYNDIKSDSNLEEKSLQYIEMVKDVLTFQKVSNMQSIVNLTIPFFLNSQDYSLIYKTEEKDLFTHLNDLLNQYNSENCLTIMAYRNYVENGSDGLFEILDPYIEKLSMYPGRRVYIALETTDISPSKITFYNKSRNILRKVINQLDGRYRETIIGYTINDLNYYTIIPENNIHFLNN